MVRGLRVREPKLVAAGAALGEAVVAGRLRGDGEHDGDGHSGEEQEDDREVHGPVGPAHAARPVAAAPLAVQVLERDARERDALAPLAQVLHLLVGAVHTRVEEEGRRTRSGQHLLLPQLRRKEGLLVRVGRIRGRRGVDAGGDGAGLSGGVCAAGSGVGAVVVVDAVDDQVGSVRVSAYEKSIRLVAADLCDASRPLPGGGSRRSGWRRREPFGEGHRLALRRHRRSYGSADARGEGLRLERRHLGGKIEADGVAGRRRQRYVSDVREGTSARDGEGVRVGVLRIVAAVAAAVVGAFVVAALYGRARSKGGLVIRQLRQRDRVQGGRKFLFPHHGEGRLRGGGEGRKGGRGGGVA
eukprot:Rhum_TRINITY_DN14380_c9_g1::Rhum_TRINITY_DN14380_c9_g1_i1::g.84473::m.84473